MARNYTAGTLKFSPRKKLYQVSPGGKVASKFLDSKDLKVREMLAQRIERTMRYHKETMRRDKLKFEQELQILAASGFKSKDDSFSLDRH